VFGAVASLAIKTFFPAEDLIWSYNSTMDLERHRHALITVKKVKKTTWHGSERSSFGKCALPLKGQSEARKVNFVMSRVLGFLKDGG
jgi:hypothetical protein